jgi:hypothetical protein
VNDAEVVTGHTSRYVSQLRTNAYQDTESTRGIATCTQVHQQHVVRDKILVLPIYVITAVWIHESTTLLLQLVTSEFFVLSSTSILVSPFNTHSTDNIVKFRLVGCLFCRWK